MEAPLSAAKKGKDPSAHRGRSDAFSGVGGYAGSYPVLRDRSQYGSMPEEQPTRASKGLPGFETCVDGRRQARRCWARTIGQTRLARRASRRHGRSVSARSGRLRHLRRGVLAMALAGSLTKPRFDGSLRWSDAVRFDQRNHFMLATRYRTSKS